MAKERSPNYPAISLTEALELARKLWAKEKRTPVTPEVAASAMGYEGLSGPTRTRLSALKKYGLMEGDRNGIRVSELAMRVLHPETPEEQQKAIEEAALKPDLFRELYQTHAEGSDEALASHLIRRGFSAAGASQFIKAFRDTLLLAKPTPAGYDAGKKLEDEEMPGTIIDRASGGVTTKQIVRVFSWPLPNDVQAEFHLKGGPITQRHLDLLIQYLELAKAAVPKEEEN